MSLLKPMATVGGLTALSRLAGFARDILTAAILGAGPVADAFFVALKLPNLFRRVTAEGAFSVSFVPLYTSASESEGQEKADLFASNAFMIMLVFLSAFTVTAMALMPWIIMLVAPGFQKDPERFRLAIELSRITFPYLLLMSLGSLLGGVQNAHGRFAPFAFAPVLFNLSLIAALMLWKYTELATPGHALAWGLIAAGFLQVGMLFFFAERLGVRVRLVRPKFDARTKKLFRLMGPGVIGAGVMHINLFADMIIGSLLPRGSISYLYYADRLNQLPLGVIGIAVGTALLPMLSRAMSGGRQEEARNLFNRALEISLFLALPAAVGLFAIAPPIILTLFRHGAFDFKAAEATSLVLTAYSLGLPAYIMSKVYSTVYWARHDTTTPVKASVVSALFNVGMSLFLIYGFKIGVVGIALSTSIAGWLQIALLHRGLRALPEIGIDRRLREAASRIVISCLCMGLLLFIFRTHAGGYFLRTDNHIEQILLLALMVFAGGSCYGMAAVATGAVKLQELKRYIKKG